MPLRLEWKAIDLPSGDHVGCRSTEVLRVRSVGLAVGSIFRT